jgi:hypothetical protein
MLAGIFALIIPPAKNKSRAEMPGGAGPATRAAILGSKEGDRN